MTKDTNPDQAAQDKPGHEPKDFPIHIDRDMFKVDQQTMTGAELRALPTPPIGEDRNLYQVVPGGQDVKVGDGDVVELKPGMHFVTAPKNVTPGASHGDRA
jgi:hypothetical protein